MRTNITLRSKYLRALSMASLTAAMLAIPVRHACAQTPQDLIEVARSVITADRKAVVVATMELTEEEGKSFWPIYHEYRAEMGKITDDLMNLVLDYAKLYPTVPEERAKQMLETYTSLQQKHVDKRAAYLKKFATVLPAAKALRFAQVETRFDLLVQLNLAARIPLAPIRPALTALPDANAEKPIEDKDQNK